jgi:hypothetical protein
MELCYTRVEKPELHSTTRLRFQKMIQLLASPALMFDTFSTNKKI